MRGRNAVLLALAVAVVASGCSRLNFVKPNAERGRYQQVAPDYNFRETRQTRHHARIRSHLMEAGRALDAGMLDEAASEARAALALDRNSTDALTMMGLVELLSGRSEQAGRHYARAVELSPATGSIQNDYGAWLCREGRAAEAMPYFNRALADTGYATPADALANAGACAHAAGRDDLTETYLRAALRLVPENTVALSAMAEYQYRNGRFLEARAFSERRLAAAPATAEVLVLAAWIEERMGDVAAAEHYRQRLGREFPGASQVQPGE